MKELVDHVVNKKNALIAATAIFALHAAGVNVGVDVGLACLSGALLLGK